MTTQGIPAGGPGRAAPAPRDPGAGLPATVWEALQPLLPGLPERERVAVMLRFVDATPQTRIAARMGLPAAQVEGLLVAALARLRDQL